LTWEVPRFLLLLNETTVNECTSFFKKGQTTGNAR
jgi:hypothetical protein